MFFDYSPTVVATQLTQQCLPVKVFSEYPFLNFEAEINIQFLGNHRNSAGKAIQTFKWKGIFEIDLEFLENRKRADIQKHLQFFLKINTC